MTTGPHVYMVIEREFLRQREPVVKPGRTGNLTQRIAKYPKGSVLLISIPVLDEVAAEKAVLYAFHAAYLHRTDIGAEYFEIPAMPFDDAVQSAVKLFSSVTASATRIGESADDAGAVADVVLHEQYDVGAFDRLPAERILGLPNADAYSRLRRLVALLREDAVPVRYYLDDDQDGFGRYKCRVDVEGLAKGGGGGGGQLPTFTTMKREIRAALAATWHWDVDIVNCQATLLKQMLRRHGIACPLLSRYVSQRDAACAEVQAACSVTRKAAKELFLRLTYGGTIAAWMEDEGAPEPPAWVHDFADQLAAASGLLLERGELHALRAHWHRRHKQRQPTVSRVNASGSMLAIYLQTLERHCLDALMDALDRDGRRVAALIHDGLLFEKLAIEERPPAEDALRRWRAHIACVTGFEVDITIKPLERDNAWVAGEGVAQIPRLPWNHGDAMLTYDDLKAEWESGVFKVNNGEFIRTSVACGCGGGGGERRGHVPYTRSQLLDAFEQLHYVEMDTAGGKVRIRHLPFVRAWLADRHLRRYDAADSFPPPAVCPPGTFDMWDGFAVQHYTPPPQRAVDVESAGVRAIVGHVHMLFGRNQGATDYVLDWMAQVFQEPGFKRGIALLLVGQEGAGKNRITDLLNAMVGQDKFLETANPGSVLYGRFTEPRRGKILIVVNEANSKDNHAANDLLKDMITGTTFVCEAKGRNALTMRCYDRFIFCTNNANALRINPDSRRFVVFEVSSEMVGNSAYFRELSGHIDDAHTRHEFYRMLMSRDISGRDWVNDRPLTDHYRRMVQMSMDREYEFLRDTVLLPAYHKAPGSRVTVASKALFERFVSWLDQERVANGSSTYTTTHKSFGVKMTALTKGQSALPGASKRNDSTGQVYSYEVDDVCAAMAKRMWIEADALVRLP